MTAPELRTTLKALGLSQRSFALRIGVETSTVNRWAMGKAPVPRYAEYILELLADRQRLRDQLSASLATVGQIVFGSDHVHVLHKPI